MDGNLARHTNSQSKTIKNETGTHSPKRRAVEAGEPGQAYRMEHNFTGQHHNSQGSNGVTEVGAWYVSGN
jgi:hypothetical protein